MSKYAAKKHKQQKITRNSSVLAIALFCCVILGTLFFVHNNAALAEAYPIKGFDVSHHQGDIDWKKISP
ncbi:MAG: lysozyme, partial [Acinetobacter sp.]|nr:lysozyme [Acinetobacter sp.]